jgi:hypothetical protein
MGSNVTPNSRPMERCNGSSTFSLAQGSKTNLLSEANFLLHMLSVEPLSKQSTHITVLGFLELNVRGQDSTYQIEFPQVIDLSSLLIRNKESIIKSILLVSLQTILSSESFIPTAYNDKEDTRLRFLKNLRELDKNPCIQGSHPPLTFLFRLKISSYNRFRENESESLTITSENREYHIVVSLILGAAVGCDEGGVVGRRVGLADGRAVFFPFKRKGAPVGIEVGSLVGLVEGCENGCLDGCVVGCIEG